MRVISSTALDALDTGRFGVRCLLKVTPPSGGPFAIWDDVGNITVSGVTYVGAAGRFIVQPSTSTVDLSVYKVDVTLSGLDSESLALIGASGWHQRPVEIYRAIIATDAPQVFHVLLEFSGFLDQAIIREQPGGVSEMKFRCESASREFDRSGARTRGNADQRARDSDDGFFEFSASAVSEPFNWGKRDKQFEKRKRENK
jgi:hypothetical protein